jgi:hypothetical protein
MDSLSVCGSGFPLRNLQPPFQETRANSKHKMTCRQLGASPVDRAITIDKCFLIMGKQCDSMYIRDVSDRSKKCKRRRIIYEIQIIGTK